MVLKIGLCMTLGCFNALISNAASEIRTHDASVEARFIEMEKRQREQSFQLKNQKKRIELLEKLVKIYNVDIDKCEHRFQRQNKVIAKLENTVTKYTEDINNLNKNLSMVYHQHTKCKICLNKRQLKIANNHLFNSKSDTKCGDEISGKGEGQRIQNTQGKQETKVLRPSRQNSIEATAFYAYMNHYEHTPSNHHVIIFDIEITDSQETYNKYTGTFSAPLDGLYAFAYTIRMACISADANSNATAPFELVRNDHVESVVYVGETVCKNQDTVSGFAILKASKGDSVYVRTHSSFLIHGNILSDNNGRTSFSGWLIK